MRLSQAALNRLTPGVETFEYDRLGQQVGIVHLGIGAFHRAHQAWYTDRALDAGERDWAIAGVSLRSASVAEQLNPQDGLFTVTEKDATQERSRLVGSVREVLGPKDRERFSQLSVSPSLRICSITVTEKGYCRQPDGSLDFEAADEATIYGYIAAALQRRMEGNLPGLTLLSCDNLAENGRQLEELLGTYLHRQNPALARWFADECSCPSTMVDRIVPATTVEDRLEVEARIGLRDEGAVVTEPFSQWVIEDRFAGARPAWERVGAQLVGDVRPYETAKLRLLNGAHSALAYLGLARGHEFVHQAIADPVIRPLVERLMREEAATSFEPAPEQNLASYIDELLARFANPALQHRLAQIAMDGSQKIPQRWLATLAVQRERGRDCPAILTGLAAWIAHVRGDRHPVNDPLGEELASLWRRTDVRGVVEALFASGGYLSGRWKPDEREIDRLEQQVKDGFPSASFLG